jgi:RNA polymerase sigma factor (sigma-70 family)
MPRERKPQPEKVKCTDSQEKLDERERWAKLVDTVRKSRDNNKANEAFKVLVSDLKPRILSVCSRYRIPGKDDEDVYQEALKALWMKAIKDYDRGRGSMEGTAPFDRFALLCIRRHLATELKMSQQVKRRVNNHCISLDQDRGDAGEDLSLVNILSASEGDVLMEVGDREAFRSLVMRLRKKLSSFEDDVLKLYAAKYTYDEIASIINQDRPIRYKVNIKGVDNALSRIKNKAKSIYDTYARQEGIANESEIDSYDEGKD